MNKAEFFAAAAMEVKEIHVEALNAVVKFRVMSGRARDAFYKAFSEGDKTNSQYESSVIMATVVDDAGAPMFDAADISALQDINAPALAEVAKHAMAVNKMGVEAQVEAAKN